MDITDKRISALEQSRSASDVRFEYITVKLNGLDEKLEEIHDYITASKATKGQAIGLAEYFKPILFGAIGALMALFGFPHLTGK